MEMLNTLQQLTEEFLRELESTQRLINALPADQLDFKPHEKSMSLGALAAHVVELTGWPAFVLKEDVLDFQTYQAHKHEDKDEMLQSFKQLYLAAEEALQQADLEELTKEFELKSGDFSIMKDSKLNMIRYIINNHIYHHRGQLTVYLRLLNQPVPGLYGPSADEA